MARSTKSSIRFVRSIAGALTAVALAAGLVALPLTPAVADIPHQIAAAEQQLAGLQAQAERVAERYNAARIRLTDDQQTAATAEASLAQANARIAQLRAKVASFAASAYEGHTTSELSALLDATPQQFVIATDTLDAISHSQQVTFELLAAARHDQQQALIGATSALAAQTQVTQSIAADKASLEASAARQEQLLTQLQAEQARLIREAQTRAAAARAAAQAAALAQQAAATRAAAFAFESQSFSPPPPQTGGSGGAPVAVQWAYREIGKPYVWGAAGPDSFDCSGLTQYVWGKAGVYLAHYTGDQWNEGTHVSQTDLQPGDLVFFGSNLGHVGLYVGSGMMIDAPHSGADVREEAVWWNQYAGAVRPG
ncbi:MAG TPA: NlpC/P60 family protein [Mycobacteriales bacterium]|nr:NlpC/P60 family protein [Mycobacteriales bacterium]